MRILWGFGVCLLAGVSAAAPSTTNRPPTLPGYQNWQTPVVADWRELNRRVAPSESLPDSFAGAAPDSVSSEMPIKQHGDHK